LDQISVSEASDLLSKLLSERISLLAFFRSPRLEFRLPGFVDSVTSDNGLVVSVSGPPIDTKRGYLHVLRFERCDFWYGERRELSPELQELGDRYGESVLTIRFLDCEDLLLLLFTL
jgi:hypothetical protein